MAFSYLLMSSMILASAQYATALRISMHGPMHFDSPEENYVQYVECASKTFLLSREEIDASLASLKGWRTNIRMLQDNSFKLIGTYATPLSHNMAPLCVDGQILLVGGQWRSGKGARGNPQGLAHYAGIQQVVVPDLTKGLDQVQPILATTGDSSTTDCIEGRPRFKDHCEFDGKISLGRKDGTTYMYARANVAIGKRWVQIANSSNHKDWSKFRPIEIEGLRREQTNTNVYFFNVEDWNSTHKAGVFPAVLKEGSGIWITFSEDMYTWSRPSLIKKLTPVVNLEKDENAATPQRVPEYPVALLNRKLLTFERHAPFEHAFSISDGPISEPPQSNLNFVPFGSFQ